MDTNRNHLDSDTIKSNGCIYYSEKYVAKLQIEIQQLKSKNEEFESKLSKIVPLTTAVIPSIVSPSEIDLSKIRYFCVNCESLIKDDYNLERHVFGPIHKKKY